MNKVQKRIEQVVAAWFMLCIGAAVLLVLYLTAFDWVASEDMGDMIGIPGLIGLLVYAFVMVMLGIWLQRKIRGE